MTTILQKKIFPFTADSVENTGPLLKIQENTDQKSKIAKIHEIQDRWELCILSGITYKKT